MKHIYTSLDIGSDSIKVVVCELYQNKLNLLASSSYHSKGIKKGLITNVEDATESIRGSLDEVENVLGIKINKVIANIPSYFANFTVVKGEIEIEGQEVRYDDINTLLDSILTQKREDDAEIITIIPVDFRVDNETGIKDPIKMNGKVLGIRAILVTTEKKYIYSVVGLLENMGLEVADISITGVGDINALRNKKMDKSVGAIINIGNDITNISLYNRGVIVKNKIINMGGKHISNDISYMYKTDKDTANELKLHFALAHKRNASTSDTKKIKTAYDDELKINQFEISEVVSSRLEEILNLAKKEINILTSKQIDYIIITGGTSNMADIDMVIGDVLGRDANVGSIKLVGIRDNKYSTCVGNIINYINKQKLRGIEDSFVSEDDASKLSIVRKNYQDINNEKMLEKLTEYFLANRRI